MVRFREYCAVQCEHADEEFLFLLVKKQQNGQVQGPGPGTRSKDKGHALNDLLCGHSLLQFPSPDEIYHQLDPRLHHVRAWETFPIETTA